MTVYQDGSSLTNEGATHSMSIISNQGSGAGQNQMVMLLDADYTNQCCALQSIILSTRVSNLCLNPRGGNVGIGVTNPVSSLDIGGGTISNVLQINGNTAAGAGFVLNVPSSTGTIYMEFANTWSTYFSSSGLTTNGTIKTNKAIVGTTSGITINSYTPTGPLIVYESTGTIVTPTQNAMSAAIVVCHGNNYGGSSILFPSTYNGGSDYGYITFIDNVANGSYTRYNYWNADVAGTESAVLVIGCENDAPYNSGPDSVIITPAGNIALDPKGGLTYITGKVGIGTTNPVSSLDIGGGTISNVQLINGVTGTGALFVLNVPSSTGAIFMEFAGTWSTYFNSSGLTTSRVSKTSGTFDIQHPLYPNTDRHLVHSFIEGPRCDLIYRGSKTLVSGTAIIDINKECTYRPEDGMDDGTFEVLCANPDWFLQNKTGFTRVIGSMSGGYLTITSEDPTSTDTIMWMVIAERKDPSIKQWDRTDSDGYLITQYTKSNPIPLPV
jgi:hypothetical protein